MIATNLTVRQIQYCIRYCGIWNPRADLMVPNVSWGLLGHEADFKKDHHHDDERIYHFYYCVPENIKDKVTGFPDENFKYGAYKPALLTYDEDGHIQKRIPGNRQNANTIF